MRKKHQRDYSRKFCTKRSSWRRDPWETSMSKTRRMADQQEIADQWREVEEEVEEVEEDSDPSYEAMGREDQKDLEVEMAWDSRTRIGKMVRTAHAVRDPDMDFKLFCLDLLQVAHEEEEESYDWDEDPDWDAWWG